MPDISTIARTTLFATLSDQEVEQVVQEGRWASFQAGDEIVHQGEFGDVMYFIMKGLVEVSRLLGNQGPRFSRLALSEGEFFGEMALLEDKPRSATVMALEPTECLVVNRDQLYRMLRSSPEIAVAMLTVMSRRLRAIGA